MLPSKIVEDRMLARIAFEAVGRNGSADPTKSSEAALGHAVAALRVLGVVVAADILRTVRADIEGIFADPARLARALTIGSRVGGATPANANRLTSSLAAAG